MVYANDKTQRLQIRLSEEQSRKLQELAEFNECGASEYVRKCIDIQYVVLEEMKRKVGELCNADNQVNIGNQL